MNKVFTVLIVVFLLAGAAAIGLWMAGALPTPGKEGGSRSTLVVGVPQIGGSFSLLNHEGVRVTDEDYKGKLALVFFGFTHCPDVCPTELQTISVAMEALGEDAAEVVPLFITVDPERDTVPLMAEFVEAFHPSVVGLTGTPEEIGEVMKKYRVYAQKRDEQDKEYYLVDHSAYTYLMGRDGELITVFSFGVTPEEMTRKIRENL
ncbi:SCO family protein [Sneathiella sp.]|uniref:SCO family protein n=1 Tax=Sneathiella sp. TaxID=1964365 RepID=UPI002FDF4E14